MKLQELVKIKSVFAPIVRLKLSPKLSYKIMKLLKEIEFDETFLNSKIKELIDEYGERDKSGKFVIESGNIVIQKDKEQECQKALLELNNLEVDNPTCSFTLNELQEITLSVQDMAIIENLIKEEN